jgi:hypothetical protein
MFKKHKYKFLVALIFFVALGGTVYYFKKKEVTKKTAAEKEVEPPTEKPTEQPKEPIVATEPIEPVTEPKAAIAVKKDLVLAKGQQQLAKVK